MWNGCMGPYFIELDDYDSVRGNAVLIYRGHRQLGICRLPEGAMGLSDARRYA
jgi:hypothetical protein